MIVTEATGRPDMIATDANVNAAATSDDVAIDALSDIRMMISAVPWPGSGLRPVTSHLPLLAMMSTATSVDIAVLIN